MTEILPETLENKVEMWQNAAHALMKSAESTSVTSKEKHLRRNFCRHRTNTATFPIDKHTREIKIQAKNSLKNAMSMRNIKHILLASERR